MWLWLSHIDHPCQIRKFLQSLPTLFFEKKKIPCANENKEMAMTQVKEMAHLFGASKINTLDGLRLEFDDSWVLIRASGTEPVIRILAESPSYSQTRDLLAKGSQVVSSCLERLTG